MPKVDFKSIGREIRKVQRNVKATRKRATGSEAQARLGDLIGALDKLHDQTTASCPKGMAGEVVALKKVARKAAKRKKR